MPQVRFQDLHQDLRNQLIRLNCGMLNVDSIHQYDIERFWDVYLRNGKRLKLQYSERYNAWYAQAKGFNKDECCPLTDTNERLFTLFLFADAKRVWKANGAKNKQGDLFEDKEKDMPFDKYLEFLIKTIANVYRVDPSEITPRKTKLCPRCNGLKVFPEFKHVRYGICHKCLGAGVI